MRYSRASRVISTWVIFTILEVDEFTLRYFFRSIVCWSSLVREVVVWDSSELYRILIGKYDRMVATMLGDDHRLTRDSIHELPEVVLSFDGGDSLHSWIDYDMSIIYIIAILQVFLQSSPKLQILHFFEFSSEHPTEIPIHPACVFDHLFKEESAFFHYYQIDNLLVKSIKFFHHCWISSCQFFNCKIFQFIICNS